MRKLLSFSIVLLGVLAASGARALPTGTAFDALLEGPASDPTSVGSLLFFFDASILGSGGDACRYTVVWLPPAGAGESSQCTLDEITWLGREGCLEDDLAPMDAIVVLAPGQDCAGYDSNDQPTDVFKLIVGETSAGYTLGGLIQYTAANATPYGFSLALPP